MINNFNNKNGVESVKLNYWTCHDTDSKKNKLYGLNIN